MTYTNETLAELVRSLYATKDMDDGTKRTVFGEGLTEEMKESLYKMGFQVKDSHYDTFMDMCDRLAEELEADKGKSIETIIEEGYWLYELEADIYTADLTAWLAEDISNLEYCDQALQDYEPKDTVALLQEAQILFKRDIGYMLAKCVELAMEQGE